METITGYNLRSYLPPPIRNVATAILKRRRMLIVITIVQKVLEEFDRLHDRPMCLIHRFELRGDINQTTIQMAMLSRFRIEVVKEGLCRYITNKEDYQKALLLLYSLRTTGWSHYRTDLIRYEICTRTTFYEHLEVCLQKGDPL